MQGEPSVSTSEVLHSASCTASTRPHCSKPLISMEMDVTSHQQALSQDLMAIQVTKSPNKPRQVDLVDPRWPSAPGMSSTSTGQDSSQFSFQIPSSSFVP